MVVPCDTVGQTYWHINTQDETIKYTQNCQSLAARLDESPVSRDFKLCCFNPGFHFCRVNAQQSILLGSIPISLSSGRGSVAWFPYLAILKLKSPALQNTILGYVAASKSSREKFQIFLQQTTVFIPEISFQP